MKIILRIINAALLLIIILVAGFAGLITYALITDFKPQEKLTISTAGTSAISDTSEFTLLTWNIGYCGLDRDMDFFYDGGTKVITTKPRCTQNLEAVKDFLGANADADFIFIQEIDKRSKRSYLMNEYDSILKVLSSYKGFFAVNYDVFFVPLPFSSPMGKVFSGLATLSKSEASSSIRYAFPGEYGFPKQLFMLDRCFIVNRYSLNNGKELLIINTHNEAFDKGNIRKAQMAYLKKFIEAEFSKGNYVITGGDWNQTPPGFRAAFDKNVADNTNMNIPEGFMPEGWKWLFDNSNPSERNVVKAYDQASTPTTIYDFFLISPNIEAISVKCTNLGFKNSDHNPVKIKVRLIR